MKPVHSASGWVVGAAYDNEANDLYVQFRDLVALYHDVPVDTYLELLNAPSAGTFIHESGLYEQDYETVG